jgi:hypothetical protein
MHTCTECGKTMATAGGLDIHMEMVHPAPAPVPVLEPVLQELAVPAAAPTPRVETRTSAPAAPLQLPAFLRRYDPTVPLTALLVLALFLAGVFSAVERGSESDAAAARLQSEAGPSAAASAPLVDPAADQRQAQSLVLDANDLPDGWTVQAHQAAPSDAQTSRDEATCLGLPDPATTDSTEAQGPDAGLQASQMGTAVKFTKTEQQARDYATAQTGPKAEACFKDFTIKGLSGPGTVVNKVGIGRFTVSTGNVRSIATHTEVAVTDNGQPGLIFVDVVYLQQGRAIGQAYFVSFGSPFPSDVEQTVVTRFAHKLASV